MATIARPARADARVAPRPDRFTRLVSRALAEADVVIGGNRPWDITIHDPRVPQRLLTRGLRTFGDDYVEGRWDCDAIDELFARCLRADLPAKLRFTPEAVIGWARDSLFNRQRHARASRNGRAHYDLGNDLFQAMLDPLMVYSCAYWKNAATLEDAQIAKLELICRKIDAQPGMRILDIGCGWGGFAQYAAERHGAHVTGITVSPAQVEVAQQRCRGLPVEIRLCDYRDMRDRFDRVVSIGMLEHVGQRNHRTYMRIVSRCLSPDGLGLIHFFSARRSWPNTRDSEVLWIERHILPGLVCPSLAQIGRAIDGLFVCEDIHGFGADYDPTLMAWRQNFDAAWPALRAHYGDRFRRMWIYYLLSCAGAFRSRKYQLWQVVLSPRGVNHGYKTIR